VIDEDGVYDPADFNDGLVLGMKGTFAQAELHIIRARLHGGKLNKASRGDLRFALPVGLIFDENKIVRDPDREVQGAVRTVFELFAREGTAFGVVQPIRRMPAPMCSAATNRPSRSVHRGRSPPARVRCLRTPGG
jgi:DNA invertase Pin-like site-specific DNA recombinase